MPGQANFEKGRKMKTVKKRTFSGMVCEQEIFSVSERTDTKKAQPRPRFRTPEERKIHRDKISRQKHRRLFNANCSPKTLYSTLTFSDDWEVHTFKEARKIRDNYFRRLLRAYPDAVIFIYMGRGKGTNRIHFHMVSNKIPEHVIRQKWWEGDVFHCKNLREHNTYNGVDCGRDYTGLADYLWNHWTEEQGGHRWKATRNLKKPDEEAPTEVKRRYSEKRPPKAPPGFRLVAVHTTEWGYLNFKYVFFPTEAPEAHERE